MRSLICYIKDKKEYFIVPFCLFVLLSFIFFIKGIYPYGDGTIINGDMGQAYVPVYYYLHDLLHNNADLLVNYNIGYGQDFFDITSIYGFLSPISWLIGLTSRSNIPNFLSILFMIRIMLLGFSSFWVMKRLFKKCPKIYIYIFSILYALSGYILGYYTNFVWLDNIILFPFLFYFFKKMLDGGKGWPFMIFMAISLSLSFYISYMEILFVLFYSFCYIHFYVPKNNRKKITLNLAIHMIFSLLISMVFWFPTVMQVFTSSRGDNLSIIVGDTKFYTKLVTAIFYALPLLGSFLFFTTKKVSLKDKIFTILIFLFLGIGIFLEPINVIWHTGSYFEFPFRYGFLLLWILLLSALFYFEKENKPLWKEFKGLYFIFGLIFILMLALAFKYIEKSSKIPLAFGVKDFKLFILFICLLLSFLILYFLVLCIRNKKLRYFILSLLIFFEVGIQGYAYLGVDKEKIAKLYTDDSIFEAQEVYTFLEDDENKMERYKNLKNDLVENYPLILNKPSTSSWHMVQKSQHRIHSILGYNTEFTKLNDNGGTLLSDQILGIHKFISRDELDSSIYQKVKGKENLYLYQFQNRMDFGIVYSKEKKKEMLPGMNPFDYQNQLYQSLFSKEDMMIETIDLEDSKNIYGSSEDELIKFTFSISKKSNLYLYFPEFQGNLFYIKVNDQTLNFPTVAMEENMVYASQLQNGVIDLGVQEGEVSIEMVLAKDNYLIKPIVAYIPLEKMNSLIKENQNKVTIENTHHSLKIKATANKDQSLFLPINYLNGYQCLVNGKETKIDLVFDNFVSIDLEEGENEIVLTYTTPYLKLCLLYSTLSLIIYFIGSFIFSKIHYKNSLLDTLIYLLYHLVFLSFFLYIYVICFFRIS